MATYASLTWEALRPLRVKDFNTFIAAPLAALRPGTYTVQTTTSSATTIAAITVPQNRKAMFYGHVFAARSDFTAGLFCRFGASYRRQTGNVALSGSYIDRYEDSPSAPTVNVNVTAPDQAIVTVHGVAGQTWDWKCVLMYRIEP